MQKYLECGAISNTHGINGGVKVINQCDTPEDLTSLEYVYIEQLGVTESLRSPQLQSIRIPLFSPSRASTRSIRRQSLREELFLPTERILCLRKGNISLPISSVLRL